MGIGDKFQFAGLTNTYKKIIVAIVASPGRRLGYRFSAFVIY